jgi:hypothetical protein
MSNEKDRHRRVNGSEPRTACEALTAQAYLFLREQESIVSFVALDYMELGVAEVFVKLFLFVNRVQHVAAYA